MKVFKNVFFNRKNRNKEEIGLLNSADHMFLESLNKQKYSAEFLSKVMLIKDIKMLKIGIPTPLEIVDILTW